MNDDYARAVLKAGQDLGIAPRGIVIAFATVFVESNWLNYANAKVAGSLDLPHDAVGSDGMSVGLFQQQVVMGNGWWWGPVDVCQDPYKSASLFFGRLKNKPYQTANTDAAAGAIAQSIQGSAFPDRYQQRMADAQALYDRINTGGSPVPTPDYGITDVIHGYNPDTGDDCTGNSNGPRAQTLYVVLHTQQAHADAVSLANFCNNSRITQPDNPVSYNLAVDDKKTVEIVPVGEGPWAAAEANDIGVHICFAGSFAEWSTAQWESTDASDGLNENDMLTRGAKAAAAACQQYGIPVVFADGTDWPALPKGIAGHRNFGKRGGGHSDPGDGFPMDEFLRRVNSFMPGATPPPVVNPPTPTVKRFPDDWTDRDLMVEILRQLRGPDLNGWSQLGNLSVVDVLAELRGKPTVINVANK